MHILPTKRHYLSIVTNKENSICKVKWMYEKRQRQRGYDGRLGKTYRYTKEKKRKQGVVTLWNQPGNRRIILIKLLRSTQENNHKLQK